MSSALKIPVTLLIASLLALMGVLLFVEVTQGGDLEPPNGPTMGTTQIPPTWHQILPADDGPTADGCNSSRFRCVFPTDALPAGAAVLDNTTGLVWERSPRLLQFFVWSAQDICYEHFTGDVKGWRPPKIEELASLVDVEAPADPMLPVGHPFMGITSDADFWSSSTFFGDPLRAYYERFDGGLGVTGKTGAFHFWCVRGGHGYDGGH